ncbi:MAG: hypothetical protein K0Q97_2970 [Bacillota bacterium]|jgi:hypothetical protein|nr:hypothetical protein [Bacillota bacterium]
MKSSISHNKLNKHETGFLEIRVMDNRNIPIPNALISIAKISYSGIYNEGAEGITLVEPHTDNNGIVHIELLVLNELMGSNDFYSAKISKEGYYDFYIYYIQIYPNIDSSYDINLTPRTNGVERFMFLFQPKRRSVHDH